VGGGGNVPFGRFGRPHGVKGEVRFWPHNPQSPLLRAGRQVRIGPDELAARAYRVESLRGDARGLLVRLSGVDDREAAGALNGQTWFEARAGFEHLGEDEHYIVDLIGLTVRTETGLEVGTVADVLQIGSSDLYVVRDGDREHLIPGAEAFVREIDLEGGFIVIRPIEGLLVADLDEAPPPPEGV